VITIFSIPKPFSGLDAIHQMNAIQSWLQLKPKCEVYLCGDDPSIIDAAKSLNVKLITGIEHTKYGTPLINSVFAKVYDISSSPIICYINSDIILLNDFCQAIGRIKVNKYLALGQRTNVNLDESINFNSSDWRKDLEYLVKKTGKLYSVDGIDYFIFTRNSDLHIIPSFAVGRPRWDNWFVFNARNKHIPVIDLTRTCIAIHQNHNYAHIPQGKENSWFGPETQDNITLYNKLVGPRNRSANIHDSTQILTKRFLLPALGCNYLLSRFQRTALYRTNLQFLAVMGRKMFNWSRIRAKSFHKKRQTNS